MIRRLRARIGRLGGVMAFLAILFAFGPALEAAACAAEGCGIACIEQTGAATAQDADGCVGDVGAGGCAEQHCIWSAGHSHAASLPVMVAAGDAPATGAERYTIAAEPVVSAPSRNLERPPRA